jgi:hypothetical protein
MIHTLTDHDISSYSYTSGEFFLVIGHSYGHSYCCLSQIHAIYNRHRGLLLLLIALLLAALLSSVVISIRGTPAPQSETSTPCIEVEF